MKEYILPFTGNQAKKSFQIFKWFVMIVSPIMIVYSIITHQLPVSSNESLWVHPLFSWGCVICGISWICSIIWWIINLDGEGKLPSFRCKYDNEQQKNGDVK